MHSLIQHSKEGTRFTCVHVHLGSHELLLNLVQFKRSRKALHFIHSHSDLPLNALKQHLPALSALIVVVSGKGLVHKAIDDCTKAFDALIPNYSEANFYAQKTTSPETQNFVSFIRKSDLQPFFQEIEKQHITPIHLEFGPFSLKTVSGELTTEIHLNNQRILLNEKGFVSAIEPSETKPQSYDFNFEEQHIPLQNSLALASGINYFTEEVELVSNVPNQEALQAFELKRGMRLLSLAALAFLFIALLVNYLIFDHYAAKNRELSQIHTHNKSLLEKYKHLETLKAKKEKVLAVQSGIQALIHSKTTDQLAASLPTNIRIDKLDLFPFQEKIQEGKRLSRQAQTIYIEGQYMESKVFTAWIKTLKQMKWIKSLSIEKIEQNALEHTQSFNLKIEVYE